VPDQPQTRYASSGDLKIGYQVLGDGPLDLVFVPGILSNIDLIWGLPASARFFRRLAGFTRLIVYDKRGQGVSDPPDEVPTLEDDMEDLRAVMDAAESDSAALFGYSEGGPMSALFAASYPDRVRGLILVGTFARGFNSQSQDSGEQSRSAGVEQLLFYLEHWGEGGSLEVFAPSIATEERKAQFAAFERAVGSPRLLSARAETAMRLDVTPVLETLKAPTLVMHRSGDLVVSFEMAREMAGAIPGARFIELPGEDHIPWVGESDRVLAEVEEFLTGARYARESERVLATVLFTDIVDSTSQAAAVGDSRWREVLDAHDRLVRERLDAYRGREVKTMGDGFLATFDGPARAIHCARSIVERAPSLGIQVRAGVHTGECELVDHDVRGVAVNIGARIGALADGGEVLVSRTVKDLVVGSGLEFEDRGRHELKGVPGSWQLFAAAADL
jgi:pimeloyl-ACP methyl ester carboxylesterase